MRSSLLRLVLVCCLSGATALTVPTSRPQVATTLSRSASPAMAEVVRVEIELEDGEPIEKALRRFRKSTNACGHLRIVRNRKTFENSHDKSIRKKKESMMRLARARRSARSRAAAGF